MTSSLQAVTSQRLYRQIADQLARKIVAGVFPAGSRLPAERDLADRLKVARSTVREALIALELGGYAEIRGGSGVFVLPQQAHGGAGPPLFMAGLLPAETEKASPFELLNARLLIEPEIAALAAIHADEAQLAAIELAHRKVAVAGVTNAATFDDDYAFHRAMANACGNAALASVVAHLQEMSRSSAVFTRLDNHWVDGEVWNAAVQEHSRLVAAIVAGDSIRARHAMSVHLMGVISRLSEDIPARDGDRTTRLRKA